MAPPQTVTYLGGGWEEIGTSGLTLVRKVLLAEAAATTRQMTLSGWRLSPLHTVAPARRP